MYVVRKVWGAGLLLSECFNSSAGNLERRKTGITACLIQVEQLHQVPHNRVFLHATLGVLRG
ncbi:MAG: hypothetical protein EBS01_12885 [Verrucomicrobia bacterium]|nr:hypothetical protein [Verrucomicrobiota bacterium]